MNPELEIAALWHGEQRMTRDCAEADRLVRLLLPHYACDFVVAEVPDDAYVVLPPGWQNGIGDPVPFHGGRPSVRQRGPVGVSLGTLRKLAREVI